MPDYMYMLESRLSAEQRAVLVRMQELAVETTTNLYLTGGAVRDLISGMSIRDLDFTVEGNPSRFARELEKGGARVGDEDEKLRHLDLIFSGDVDGSIEAAREEVYPRPGARPEMRWSTIMDDLRRRDFSLNAVAISLNAASRGLLLDPTNGLADLEAREVRALSIHSFTNQPVRLLRAVRYASRMGFKLEPRTQEWFALALERDLQHTIAPEDAGEELRNLAREERPAPILKALENHEILDALHPLLAKKHPDYDAIARLTKVREDLLMAGLRPRLTSAMTLAIFGRLKDREQSSLLSKLGFRSAEAEAVLDLEDAALKAQKELAGRRANAPIDAYRFLEKLPLEQMAYLLAESSNSKALSKIRAYVQKWRPVRAALPTAITELESIGMPRGPKFDAVIEQLFAAQLSGKGKTHEDRVKILRRLSGIKEPPKKKAEEKKKKSGKAAAKRGAAVQAAHRARAAAGSQRAAKAAPISPHSAKGKPVPAHVRAKGASQHGAKKSAK